MTHQSILKCDALSKQRKPSHTASVEHKLPYVKLNISHLTGIEHELTFVKLKCSHENSIYQVLTTVCETLKPSHTAGVDSELL